MIPVRRAREYAGFNAEVRVPGNRFLDTIPSPSSREFKGHTYWRRAGKELCTAYSNRCAYTSMYLFTDDYSVDHFRPKVKYPRLAYEWDNFRLARPKINARKGDTEEVTDPFEIVAGWFTLKFPGCLVAPGDDISAEIRRGVSLTIDILQLNEDDDLVQERCNWIVWLKEGEIDMKHLDRCYPFLSAEIKRQELHDDIDRIFRGRDNRS